MNIRGKKGITLIALVITIIILIILAGVAINLSIGENGLLNRTKEAKQKYEIAEAKEELDLRIAELQVQKQGKATLQDVVDMLKAKEDTDYIVSLEEIATITGVETIGNVEEIYVVYKIYQFRVDKQLQTEFISIVENYTSDVQISSILKSHDGKNEDEKYLATFEITVESQGQVQSIEIETVDGKITEVPTSLPYTKEIQVEIGKKYIVKVTTPDGKHKRYVLEEKAEETIMTAEELASFRDRVNSGLTYEGKAVKLGANIDLSTVCGENVNGEEISWEPIGYYINTENYLYFKGTFDGNYHKISNLYYNNSPHSVVDNYIGLFTGNEGNIKNIYLEDANITVKGYSEESSTWKGYVGGITGINRGIIDNIGIERGNIKLIEKSGRTALGGIVGLANSNSIIRNSYNKANVSGMASNSNLVRIGGIAGEIWRNGVVENCYNTGSVTVEKGEQVRAGGIAGVVIKANGLNPIVTDCYNIGTLSNINGTTKYIGGIVGTNGESSNYPGGKISNSYVQTTLTTYSYYYWNGTKITTSKEGMVSDDILKSSASTLEDAFTDDIQNEDGTWKYNNGYPILKWQLEEN